MSLRARTGSASIDASPVTLASASGPLSRLVDVSRAIAAESESRRMLRVACRELTQMVNAVSCAISRLDNGLLRAVAEYSSESGFLEPAERGYYLAENLADLTGIVHFVQSGEVRESLATTLANYDRT